MNENIMNLNEKYKNEFPIIKTQAEKLRAHLKDFKFPLGSYMDYILNIKTLKNNLINNTITELKDKLKVLGATEEEIKKLDKKIDYVNKVVELL